MDNLLHPAYVSTGTQLETVIADLEAGAMPLPETAPWRTDLPAEQADRLARACGATGEVRGHG